AATAPPPRPLFFGGAIAAVLADGEVQRELPAGDLVERLGEERRVLRLLGQLPVEGGGGRELDREPVVGELGGMSLAEHRGRRDRSLLDGGQDRPLPSLLQLLQLERRPLDRLLLRTRLLGPRLGTWSLDRAGM